MNEEELLLEVAGLTVAGLAWGNPGDPPVLALHGWMDHAGSFSALAPHLSGYRTVAVDLPGHGLSELGPAGDWYSFADNLWVIHEIINALGWEQCHLLGHSMGAGLATLYAGAFADPVRSLISIDMIGPVSSPPDEVVSQIRRGVIIRSKGASGPRCFPTRKEAIATRIQSDFDLACAEALAVRGIARSEHGWYWRGDRRLKYPSLNRFTEAQVEAALQALSCPILLIRAEKLRYPAFEELVQNRLTRLADAQVVTSAGGHHLHMEHPEENAATILKFWSGIK